MPNTLLTRQLMAQLDREVLEAALGRKFTPREKAAAYKMSMGVGKILGLLDANDPRARLNGKM